MRQPMAHVADGPGQLDLEPDDGFEQLLVAAIHYRIASGPIPDVRRSPRILSRITL